MLASRQWRAVLSKLNRQFECDSQTFVASFFVLTSILSNEFFSCPVKILNCKLDTSNSSRQVPATVLIPGQ